MTTVQERFDNSLAPMTIRWSVDGEETNKGQPVILKPLPNPSHLSMTDGPGDAATDEKKKTNRRSSYV